MPGISHNPRCLLNISINQEACERAGVHFCWLTCFWWMQTYVKHMHTLCLSRSIQKLRSPPFLTSRLSPRLTLCVGTHAHANRHTDTHLTSCISRTRAGRHTVDPSLMFLRLGGRLTLTCCDSHVFFLLLLLFFFLCHSRFLGFHLIASLAQILCFCNKDRLCFVQINIITFNYNCLLSGSVFLLI